VKDYIGLLIWAVIIGGVFAFAWRKGLLLRMANYVMETREELRKCTWPTYDELKGSTIVVLVATAILGAFTIGADAVISQVIGLVMR